LRKAPSVTNANSDASKISELEKGLTNGRRNLCEAVFKSVEKLLTFDRISEATSIFKSEQTAVGPVNITTTPKLSQDMSYIHQM
jgi:hypothetical protein